MRARTALALLSVALLALTAVVFECDVGAGEAPGDQVLEDHACLQCHGFENNEEGAPFVPGHRFLDSVHKGIDCTDCHDGDYESYPHGKDGETAQCGGCHDDVFETLKESVHGAILGDAESPETSKVCAACHGTHDVFPPADRRSHLYPLNVPRACGGCHFEQKDAKDLTTEQMLEEKYTDDTHGRALLQMGLVVAPTCVSCHGGHGILASEDPKARVNPRNVSQDCGHCHVGILEQYRQSIHGRRMQAFAEGRGREPATCTDCHKPHDITRVDANFKLQIIKTCSGCHGKKGNTYRGTYHGRVAEIGFGGGIASCDDCHTAHRILPESDPNSSVNPDRRVATCRKCHPGATREFTTYLVHADPMDRKDYAVLYWARRSMRGLIFFTWAIWAVHLLLWFYRSLRDRKKIDAQRKPTTGRWYRRWPWTYRAIHLTLIVSFLLLALTGLPLRFHDAPWSNTLFSILGGPGNARLLHRLGAVLTLAYGIAFVVMIAWRFFVQRERGMFWGPNSLVPRLKDAEDMRDNLRYFLGGGKPPRFDRWTYWEKFDFLAEVWGFFFIGFTGLMMWFPVFFTSFLPGWALNLAHILHSYEALLATSFIFSIHFFNVNLRPGKFPVDPLFLTGRISEEELRHERPLEYERMRADGRLEN
ncbi:MAG: cytochrome c3 family protein, partial [Planctomycetota bacterium]